MYKAWVSPQPCRHRYECLRMGRVCMQNRRNVGRSTCELVVPRRNARAVTRSAARQADETTSNGKQWRSTTQRAKHDPLLGSVVQNRAVVSSAAAVPSCACYQREVWQSRQDCRSRAIIRLLVTKSVAIPSGVPQPFHNTSGVPRPCLPHGGHEKRGNPVSKFLK